MPVLSIYVFAGYKLLPIFQNIYFSLTQIKSAIPALDRIKIELNESKKYYLDKKINQNSVLFKYDSMKSLSLKIYLFIMKTIKKL